MLKLAEMPSPTWGSLSGGCGKKVQLCSSGAGQKGISNAMRKMAWMFTSPPSYPSISAQLHKKRNLILDKIKKVFKRGYEVIPKMVNHIKSLIHYFGIPKDDDVRLVQTIPLHLLALPRLDISKDWIKLARKEGRVLGTQQLV
jgi:hypothetical protein